MTLIADPTTTAPAPDEAHPTELLELPLSIAKQSASAMLAVMAEDVISPVLSAAHFDGERLLATDRYRCARFDLPTAALSDDRLQLGDGFLIPIDALRWVVKVKPNREQAKVKYATVSDAGYTIRYRKLAAHVAVELVDVFGRVEANQTVAEVEGNFPPLMNLFSRRGESPAGAEHRFDPKLMGALMTFAGKYSTQGEPFHLQLGANPSAPDRPGPAMVTAAGAVFLIMPVMS